jgi:SAM-dependent methyltransferase
MTSFARRTDKDWEKWGKENPYYGVLGTSRFLNSNLTDESLREFFMSGERHVEHVFEAIRSRIQPGFSPQRILDYGCGIARLVIPFSSHAREVVGVDISPAMLEEARKNCQKYGANSARLMHADGFWSLEPASFDFVHSFIVLQHIPVKRGEQIIKKMVSLLMDGGIGAIHVTFSNNRSRIRRLLSELPKRSYLINGLLNWSKGYSFGRPGMQMNNYSLNRIFDMLLSAQCSHLDIELFENGGSRGAILYFKKSPVLLPY